MAEIFLTNLPHNCSSDELRRWAQSQGIKAVATRIILDLVAGVAPAFGYIELESGARIKTAAATLNGKRLRNHTVIAKPVQTAARAAHRAAVR